MRYLLPLASVLFYLFFQATGYSQTFVHPGVYYTANDLAYMRAQIAANTQPCLSGFRELEAEIAASGGSSYTPHAVAVWDVGNNPYWSNDPIVAHENALAWAVTGNQTYANTAIAILNAWSSTLTSDTDDTPANQSKVECGWNICHMVAAAELLATYTLPPGVGNGGTSGWSSANIAQFRSMLTLVSGPGGSGGPAGFMGYMPTYNGNWDAATMNSTMAIAIFNNDSALFQNVINHFNGTDQTKGVGDFGYLEGYIVSSGTNIGQCEESGRDQGHVQMGLGNYLAVCELAWKQGTDLYSTDNNLLLKGLEYTANYNLGGTVPFTEFPGTSWTVISSGGQLNMAPIWELAYRHYYYDMGLATPYTQKVVLATAVYGYYTPTTLGPYRPEIVGQNTGMGMGTLTESISDDLGDFSFESPSVGSASYQYDPPGSSWTFTGNSGIQSNGSAWGAPLAPDGTQTAFLQGISGANGTISQVLNFPSTGIFTVSLETARRNHNGSGPQSFNVLIDGTVVGSFSPTLYTFTSITTNQFNISTTGNHTLSFVGLSTTGDESDFLDSVALNNVTPVVVVPNSSFETPVTSTYVYNPTGGSWTFTGNSGIQSNGSAWGASPAPDGNQTAFLQGISGANGTISQVLNFPATGTFTVSFLTEERYGGTQSFNVEIDGTVVGSYTPTSHTFTSVTTSPFTVSTTGNHTLSFVGTSTTGNNSDFLDTIQIQMQ